MPALFWLVNQDKKIYLKGITRYHTGHMSQDCSNLNNNGNLFQLSHDSSHLLPSDSEEREVLGVGSIPVAILPSCRYMKMLHRNCIDMDIVW